jgi:hypothetical protein
MEPTLTLRIAAHNQKKKGAEAPLFLLLLPA